MVCHKSRRVQSVMSAKKLFLVSDNLNLTFNLSKIPHKKQEYIHSTIQIYKFLIYTNFNREGF